MIAISLPIWGRFRRLIAWIMRDRRAHVKPGIPYTASAWIKGPLGVWECVTVTATPLKNAKVQHFNLGTSGEDATVLWGGQVCEGNPREPYIRKPGEHLTKRADARKGKA